MLLASLLPWCSALSLRPHLPRVSRRRSSHCFACLDDPSAGLTEAAVAVRSAGDKGDGAFAMEPIKAGTWVGTYTGTLTTHAETEARYGSTDYSSTDYLFTVDETRGLGIDARNSSHFSRFINHAEHGNVEPVVDTERLRVDFFAIRDVAPGDELSFDYGVSYWLFRPPPLGDSRNFSDPGYRARAPELSLLYPPPVGTVFPLTPLTALELAAALALPEEESRVRPPPPAAARLIEPADRSALFSLPSCQKRPTSAASHPPSPSHPAAVAQAALLRCLEYFGARRLDGDEAARHREAEGDEADVSVALAVAVAVAGGGGELISLCAA